MYVLAWIETGSACEVGERGKVYFAQMLLPRGGVAHGVHVEAGYEDGVGGDEWFEDWVCYYRACALDGARGTQEE